MRNIKEVDIFMFIKADSGNYVARLFYILYGVRYLRPQGVRHLRPHKGENWGLTWSLLQVLYSILDGFRERGGNMTIKEVSEKFDITADTLRYYERVGLIPPVARNANGNRDYQEKDVSWVEHTVCMRNAGVPIEALIEYVKLFQMGDATFGARLDLLKEQYEKLEEQRKQIEATMDRLHYKISKYEEAVKTGKLVWDR